MASTGKNGLVDIKITTITLNGLNLTGFVSSLVEKEIESLIADMISTLLDTKILGTKISGGKLEVIY